MRLSKIKLVGFKSFVDPTVLELKDQRTAIVGPNGCGKSNIIDAIRWVMGESSAKHMRGESMADVIFKGSSSRNPIGQASVELTFDNSQGRVVGEYAAYAEISVKRVVQRDGKNDYFLNNTKCRKKDVVDVFLGTGLGPRSYAIIKQDMVSRVIESDDLRAFFEEAAGVSLYKKRRRETELRINHTKENLDRVSDILVELNKQLEKLARQAKTAEKYTQLKEELKTLEIELLAMQWQKIKAEIEKQKSVLQACEVEVEKKNQTKVNLESNLEQQRVELSNKNEALKQIQHQYYEFNAAITKVESEIALYQQRLSQMSQDLANIDTEIANALNAKEVDAAELASLSAQQTNMQPNLTALQELLATMDSEVAAANSDYEVCSNKWDNYQEKARRTQASAQSIKVKVAQLEQKITEANSRNKRLVGEKQCFDLTALVAEAKQLEVKTSEQQQAYQKATDNLEQLEQEFQALEQQQELNTKQLNETETSWQKLQGRHESLTALQQAALAQDNKDLDTWLKNNNLAANKKLLQNLSIKSGWEIALAAACGELINATVVDSLEKYKHQILDLPATGKFQLKLIATDNNKANNIKIDAKLKPLLDLLDDKCRQYANFLQGVFYCESLSDALEAKAYLAASQFLVTKAGDLVGTNWLKTAAKSDTNLASIKREAEIADIGIEIEKIAREKTVLQQQKQQFVDTINLARNNIKNTKAQVQTLQNSYNQSLQSLSIKKSRIEQINSRINTIDSEIIENQAIITSSDKQVKQARVELEAAVIDLDSFNLDKDNLQQQRDLARENLHAARAKLTVKKDEYHQLELEFNTIVNKVQTKQQNLARLDAAITSYKQKQNSLNLDLAATDAPIKTCKAELEKLLQQASDSQKQVATAENAKLEVETNLQQLEQQRLTAEQQLDVAKEQLTQAKIDLQGILVNQNNIQTKMQEYAINPEQVLAQLDLSVDFGTKSEQVSALEQRISRLGAVNLAAVEEYKLETQRHEHLQAQHDDLTAALATLEEAIAKINKESKAKFKETYDKVNASFKILFPKLFGGGEAYLDLIGEDLLQAQVAIIARPPGKKNSSIHLLSGGEKALTAVALVFAIFQLNPSPFCVLDEVDAPLDDANVGRFCALLQEMSKDVQFIFITHNKITMEMAHTLSGVTMKEPGVSRLVTVNVAEAAAMVD